MLDRILKIILISVFFFFHCNKLKDEKNKTDLGNFFKLFNEHFTQAVREGRRMPRYTSADPNDQDYYRALGKYSTKEQLAVSNFFYGNESPEYYDNYPSSSRFYDALTVRSEVESNDDGDIFFVIRMMGICEFGYIFGNEPFTVQPKKEIKLRFKIQKIQGQFTITGISQNDFHWLYRIWSLGQVINSDNALVELPRNNRTRMNEKKIKQIQETCGVNFIFEDCNSQDECRYIINKYGDGYQH